MQCSIGKMVKQAAGPLAVYLLASLLFCPSHSQVIEDVRLVNGTYGDHMGRVELLVNGTWGTICNEDWNYPDARAACRMLDLITVVCTVDGPTFGDPADVPILMRSLYCRGRESDLNDCDYELAGPSESCQAAAGAVCVKSVVGQPTNVTVFDTTATSVTVGFELPSLPDGVARLRYRLRVRGSRNQFCYSDNDGSTSFQCTYRNLSPNTTYDVSLRVDVVYSVCSETGYLYGNESDSIEVRTAARVRPPVLPVRLVPPRADATFMGRLEVMYNGTWGTVCDDAFQVTEANVACETLGYERAMCYVREARFGRGTGPIWIDNLDCARSHDLLSECDFNDWGDTNCDHDEDVGVICWPDEYQQPVSNVRVVAVSGAAITVAWEPYSFPPLTSAAGYRISYSDGESTASSATNHTVTQYTIVGLRTNVSYAIRVRARFHYSEYCITRTFTATDWSTAITATTMEIAPSAPPSFFHVVVLNSSAIQFEWELPPAEFHNGVIRGYKMFVRERGSTSEMMTEVQGSDVNDFIVGGLNPATPYECSVLAYTVADGPRTFVLTVSTYTDDYIPFIINFGIDGDGLDKATRKLGSDGDISVHCDAGLSNITIDWFFSNGTQVGSQDRNVRQAKYSNGTTVLQIARGRTLGYCDGGLYTCRATSLLGGSQERRFNLRVDTAPPTPGIAYARLIGSTWITIAWTDLPCDGGHKVTGHNIKYAKDFENYLLPSNSFIFNINASLGEYTIQNLEPSTSYNISIQAVSADFRMSSYSTGNIITTLPEAPSPPRSVRARLISPSQSIVEVSWREPAATNGIISEYTVFVTSGVGTVSNGGGITLDQPETFNRTYPGHVGAVNITVSTVEVYYFFQVRASNLINRVQNYGELSQVTPESTVFVPSRDLPVPRNVQVSDMTNSTATLSWDYPEQPYDPITNFQVVFTATVEWYSPQGTLVTFREYGRVSTLTNTVTISQLTPDTEYMFRVSAVVENGERGAEVVVSGQTDSATGEKLAYFQIRISRIETCLFCQDMMTDVVGDSLFTLLNSSLCPSCGLTSKTITDGSLRCQEGEDQAVFRARLIGTSQYSASDLLRLLQTWVESGAATLTVNAVSYPVEASCPTLLDSLDDPGCAVAMTTTTTATSTSSVAATTTPPPTTPPPSVDSLGSQGTLSGGQIGGLVIGVLIVALLVIFIALLLVLLQRSFRGTSGTKPLVNDTSIVFNDIKHEDEDFKNDVGGDL